MLPLYEIDAAQNGTIRGAAKVYGGYVLSYS